MPLSNLDPTLQMYRQWGQGAPSPQPLSQVTMNSGFGGPANPPDVLQQAAGINPLARGGVSPASTLQNPMSRPIQAVPLQKIGTGGSTPAANTSGTGPVRYDPSKNPFGSSGINYNQGMSNAGGPGEGQFDPAVQRNVDAWNRDQGTLDPRLRPGGGWTQIGGDEYHNGKEWNDYLFDSSGVEYDPKYGYIAPTNKFRDRTGSIDRWAPAAAAAAFAGPALFAAGAGAGGAGGYVDVLGDAAEGANAGAATTGSLAGAGAGNPYQTLPDFQSPAGTLPEMTDNPFGTPTASGEGSVLNNPYVRGAGSVASHVLGGATNSGPGARPMPYTKDPNTNEGGQGPGNGSSWQDWLQGGLNFANDSNDINQYKQMVNEYMNRGDYNAQYRPGQLNRLNQFLMDPESALQDPTYQKMRQGRLDNVSRTMAARGMSLSGNELGVINEEGIKSDYSKMDQVENQLRSAAQLGNPDQMARAGILTLPMLFQMRANRAAAANGIYNRGQGPGRNGRMGQQPNGENGPQWESPNDNGDNGGTEGPDPATEINNQIGDGSNDYDPNDDALMHDWGVDDQDFWNWW